MSELLDEHRGYMADPVRIELFRQACRKVLSEGDVVADLGCGTGILGVLCLQAGAAHCYEIERGPIIEIARETFCRAGLLKNSTFIQQNVDKAQLDQKVDVVVCDHVGFMGIDYGLIDLLKTARHLHRKTGARSIPQQLALEIAPVYSPHLYGRITDWTAPHVPAEFHHLAEQALGEKYGVYYEQRDIIGSPISLPMINLTKDQPDAHRWEFELTANHTGPMNGLGIWFNCQLAEDVWMTNSPMAQGAIKRKQIFVPINPLNVDAGGRIKVTMMARPGDGLYSWDIESKSGDKQSYTIMPPGLASAQTLRLSAPGFVPSLNEEGARHLAILKLCDGKKNTGEISEAVLASHPQLFVDEADAKAAVLLVLQKNAT